MKNSLIAAALLGLASSIAYGQSSVTLYGLTDEGLDYTSNAGGKSQYAMVSGVLQGSRWGLRGTEDLGGGLSALYLLENGFDLNTGKLGQGGLEFGRQAYVGLSNSLGTVTLGRQYDSGVDYVETLTFGSQYGGYIGAHPADIDNLVNTFRVNNSVKYASPKLGGFTFGGLYSVGGVAGDVTRNQIFSLGGRYEGGSVVAGVAYVNVRNPNTSFYGSGGTVAPTVGGVPGSNFSVSPVSSSYASAHTLQMIDAGASYTFGPGTLGAIYTNTKFMNLGNVSSGPVPARGINGTATFNDAEINFRYFVAPTFLVAAAYNYTRNGGASGAGGATYNQGALAADYFLSKRTDIYAVAVYQRASGTDSTGKQAVASINQLTPSSSNHQTAFRIAIRHKF